MVLGNESPETRIGRTVAVIAHHPVVVHLERVAVGRFVVDVYTSVAHFEFVVLVHANRAFVKREVFFR